TLTTSSCVRVYTLSLHDALPDLERTVVVVGDELPALVLVQRLVDLDHVAGAGADDARGLPAVQNQIALLTLDREAQALRDVEGRSEEHTSELQSREKLVCRLLLE